jgi:hypothetical protein
MHYYVVAPGDGWLSVQKEDGKLQGLCANTEVEVYKRAKGRTHLKVLEGASKGLLGNLGDENARRYLTKSRPVQGAAMLTLSSQRLVSPWHSKAKKQDFEQHLAVMTYGRRSVTVTLNTSYPKQKSPYTSIPNGEYNLRVPDFPHAEDYTSEYRRVAPTLKYDRVWFPVEYDNNSRYVHVGNVSHGCVTVVELERWAEVYEYLIKHRLPGGQYVGKLVVRP